jgi:hypothetical protein
LAHFVGSLLAVFSASRQDRNCALSESAYKGAAYQNLTFTIEMGVYHVEKLIRISRLLESVKDIYKLNSVTRRDLSQPLIENISIDAWGRGVCGENGRLRKIWNLHKHKWDVRGLEPLSLLSEEGIESL